MKKFRVFPGIIFVLLGMNVLIVGYTVYAAGSDGGAVIEPDYYQKALAYDRIREQERADAALGWRYEVGVDGDPAAGDCVLRFALSEADAQPIRGATIRAVAFPSMRAGQRSQLLLHEGKPGDYAAPIRITHPGEWRIEFTIESRGRVVNHKTGIMFSRVP